MLVVYCKALYLYSVPSLFFMFNYLDAIQLIIMSINLFGGIVRAALTLNKKNTIDLFVSLMYFSAILNLIGQFINYFLCKDEEIYPVCVGTWITFSITLEWTLALVCVLQYLTFYLLQTQSKDFLDEMQRSRKQIIFFALFFPLLINILNLFVDNSYYRIFYPPNNKFQIIVLFAPLSFLLIIFTIFTILSIKMLIQSKDFILDFRKKFKKMLNISLWMILLIFIPFLLILLAAQFTNSLNICYFVLLGIVNCQILVYNYLFGLNPYIQKIQLIKLSKLIGVTPSDIDESDQYTNTQYTVTETQFTNNLRQSNNHSKVVEVAISRTSANIKSETIKPIKMVHSEKHQVTQVEMKQKAKS